MGGAAEYDEGPRKFSPAGAEDMIKEDVEGGLRRATRLPSAHTTRRYAGSE
jgi:hypothetical protein